MRVYWYLTNYYLSDSFHSMRYSRLRRPHVWLYHLILHLVLPITLGSFTLMSVEHLCLKTIFLLEYLLVLFVEVGWLVLHINQVLVAVLILILFLLLIYWVTVAEKVVVLLVNRCTWWSVAASTVGVMSCLIEEVALIAVAWSWWRTEGLSKSQVFTRILRGNCWVRICSVVQISVR